MEPATTQRTFSARLNNWLRESRPQGFTLVELLVVIVIIAILAGLLLPALSKARQVSQKAICLSNLKQLHLGSNLYTQDNKGELPGNYDGPLWASGEMLYENHPDAPIWGSDSTNYLKLVPGPVGSGSIGPYVGNARVYRCPSDRSWILLGGTRHERVRSYSMNDYFGVAPNKLEDNYVQFWTESDLNHMAPSDLFQFIDEHEDSINFWNFGVFMDYSRGSKTKIADLPASHHSKGTCLSFADGHATAKTWIDSRTVRKVEHLSWWLGSAPQPSPNNLDIEWLGRHTTIERQ